MTLTDCDHVVNKCLLLFINMFSFFLFFSGISYSDEDFRHTQKWDPWIMVIRSSVTLLMGVWLNSVLLFNSYHSLIFLSFGGVFKSPSDLH